MGSDLRMTAQSGIRLPPYHEKEKGSVNVAWHEMAKVLFQFSYVSGIMASDAFVEKWVAKHLIKTNHMDRFQSVTEYFRANPAHAAQSWSFVPWRFLAPGPEKRGLRSKNCTAKSIKSL